MSYQRAIAHLGSRPNVFKSLRARGNDISDGSKMVWQGFARGKSAAEVRSEGLAIIGGRMEVGGWSDDAKDSIVGFSLNVAHVLLIIGGLMLLWRGLML